MSAYKDLQAKLATEFIKRTGIIVQREIDGYVDKNMAEAFDGLVVAANRLLCEVGSLEHFEVGIRHVAGNTNWQALVHAHKEMSAALRKAGL